MIVGECMPDPRDELVLMATVSRNAPDSLHDLGRERDGLALLKNLQILVADHVKKHGIEGLIARREMRREPARSDQYVVRVREVAVVLTVDKQQIDATRRRAGLERIGHSQQDSSSGGAVIGAGYGPPLLREIGRPGRPRPPGPGRQ